MPFIVISLVIAAALGGGATAVAHNSLPGDALWGFKVHINEGLRGALSASSEAKANWDIAAIETRLQEAEALAAKGRLSAKTQASVTANIQAHAEGLASAVAKLQAEGRTDKAAEVATRYQAALAAHIGPLAEVQNTVDGETAVNIAPLLMHVRTELDAASDLSAKTSADAAVDLSVGL